MDVSLRLLDFNVYNEEVENDETGSSDDGTFKKKVDNKEFVIQLFGLDENGDDYSIYIEEFQPFFYVKVADNWSKSRKMVFFEHIKETIGNYYSKSITDCKIIKREELYGFDNHKEYKFILFKFKNTQAYNKVKNLFYMEVFDHEEKRKVRKLNPNGYIFQDTHVRLYEANIPPLLRYFHIKDISPSGWITIPKKHLQKHHSKMTNCKYEYTVNHRHIISLKNKETKVPYKICSFDIEASSSHGDFPLAIKTYKKLVAEMLDYWDQNADELKEYTRAQYELLIENIVLSAFGFTDLLRSEFNLVYPKRRPTSDEQVKMMVQQILQRPVRDIKKTVNENTIAAILQQTSDDINGGNHDNDSEDGTQYKSYGKKYASYVRKNDTIVDILNDTKMKREDKLNEITIVFDTILPKLEGDKVTFIGSTFIKYGEEEPYLNHCIALDTCNDVDGAEIERYDTEKKVLLAWTKLIQRENPDIVIGYNIFGFDYKFMYQRALENGFSCARQFLKLSRNKDEICGKEDKDGNLKIEETSLTIASGTHNLSFIKMNGRIQIDLYNYFRREYNLTSYKLDYVSGYFIGDKIKKYDHFVNDDGSIHTQIISKNLTGLKNDSYIHIEEIGHSSEFYDGGAKFHIYDVNEEKGTFSVSREIHPDTKKILKWCLAKDDVSPHDIFRMTNEGPKERAVIAKYCIQDCNLVHHLLKKIDVITGMVEMANICSVPIDFIVMRGQGIKLFSFIAKKCREAKTLIPVLEKKNDGGYEGAIVLPPKCGLYLDEPVACVDYSSLYPSSMISENLSHDSKVWALEYDLDGNLISDVGVKDTSGNYIYDNLPEYEYVDVEYDTYEYLRKTEKSAAVKTKVGHKKCRFAQFPNGELAIMPRILKELLAARKATRASAKCKTITTSIGEYSGMVIEKNDTHITLKDKDGNIKIIEQQSVQNIRDTYDDFMKNVLDKRQLAIKVTANSLYGQCGAKTSSFYEKDVAASTTATGRKLLTYGKRIIEEVYGDRICETQYGTVHSHAEYIYGDSVTGDTPIMLKRKSDGKIFFKEIHAMSDMWKSYEEFKPFDTYTSNRREKQQSDMVFDDTLVWTAGGWSEIKKVIRHKCNKRIYRINTGVSVVDVTEDHSLLDENMNIIKPTQLNEVVNAGDNCDYIKDVNLLHHYPLFVNIDEKDNEEYVNKEIEGVFTYPRRKQSRIERETTDNPFVFIRGSTKIERAEKYLNYVRKGYMKYKNIIHKSASCELLHDTYDEYVYDIETTDGTFNTGFPLIVKNTDSVFMSFKLTDPVTGDKIVGKEALKHTIELAKEAGELATKFLKPPHDLEYEKTFMPFCLLSKKRYVGMLYEEDPDKCYRKSMGIVLKRRDNAPIVKDVYGGIIDILMKDQNVSKAIQFTKNMLNDIVEEKFPLDKLIITKSLRAFYKNPKQIAHKVLADRIGKRDPGNKPGPGDRVPFVYIQTKGKVKLQGDKVEHPEYIVEHKLKPDFTHYITNQIMKPVQQVFALVLQDIPEYKSKRTSLKIEERKICRKYKNDEVKKQKYIQDYRNKEVKKLIFDDSLRKCDLRKNNQQSILSFFG